MAEFIVGVAVGGLILCGVAIAGYFVLRRMFERASHRVADDIGRVLAEVTGRVGATPAGARAGAAARAAAGQFTHLGAYAAAEGMTEAQARREFADSIERTARLMDGAIRVPILGPVGLDAALGLFPIAGDAVSAVVAVSLISRSLKYGIPGDIIARMLANVLVDVLMGAVPFVGDLADIWFRANTRNVRLLRDYLASEANDIIDVTPVKAGG